MALAGRKAVPGHHGCSRHVPTLPPHGAIHHAMPAATSDCLSLAAPICVSHRANLRSRSSQYRKLLPHAATLPASQPISNKAQPDLILEAQGLKHQIHVFGIEHTSSAPAIAEYILRTRPVSVVVETSVTPEHGARPGNAINCSDRLVDGPSAFYMRMFCSVAAGLNKQAAEHGGDMTSVSLWKQATDGAYRGEQLVYVAALACGSPLLFGDRPKDITYRRLYTLPTPAQLDEGYARQAAINYMEMLNQPRPVVPIDAAGVVERISMQEREAVMCSVAHNAARGASITPPSGDATQTQSSNQGDVVMVVGAAHLPGLEQLWSGARWRELLGCTDAVDSGLMTSPPLDSIPPHEVGLRRGLLLALMRMSATAEVLADIDLVLGPVPTHQQPMYQGISEVYGSTRLMLSCLDRDLLNQVCQGVRDENGVQSDLWDVLSDVRSIRPSQGGPGASDDMVTFIRSLNFDLD